MIFRALTFIVTLTCYCFSADPIVKIVLNSEEVITNCKLEKLVGDTLYISSLAGEKTEIIVDTDEITVIITSKDLSVHKYDFTEFSHSKKIKVLNDILFPSSIKNSAQQNPQVSIYSKKQFQLVLILSALLVIVIAILISLRFKTKPEAEDGIPGVEEMAKTTFFWAEWHRKKNRDD